MATFSKALEHLKANGFVKRKVIKNDTVIGIHKDRLYQVSGTTGVRYPYVPTNKDLMAEDWSLSNEQGIIKVNPDDQQQESPERCREQFCEAKVAKSGSIRLCENGHRWVE